MVCAFDIVLWNEVEIVPAWANCLRGSWRCTKPHNSRRWRRIGWSVGYEVMEGRSSDHAELGLSEEDSRARMCGCRSIQY